LEDEENHLEAMVQFLITNHIDDDLRAHRWDVVARVYNGPGYAEHGYHTRLAQAYAKWSKIRDTPWKPETESKPVPLPLPVPAKPEAPAKKSFLEILQSIFSLVIKGGKK